MPRFASKSSDRLHDECSTRRALAGNLEFGSGSVRNEMGDLTLLVGYELGH